jgi:Uma2 family endonuclease
MSMAQLIQHWTVDDIHALPDDGNRYEVIDGELLVTPAPRWRHQRAIGVLYGLLRSYVDGARVGDVLFAPADVVFSPTRLVQPDLFVVPLVDGRRPEQFADVGRLLLAVEVLSPSTARADRVAKRTLFRDQRVPEYWVVDLEARTIERATPAADDVEILGEQLSWQPHSASAPLIVDLRQYFSTVLDV